MVSTFGRAQGAAQRAGFKDDIDTYILIAGKYTATWSKSNHHCIPHFERGNF